MKPLHIMLIRFSSLGDIALNTSLPMMLKKRWGPSIHLTFLTTTPYQPLLEGTPYIDQVHSYDKKSGLGSLIKKVKSIHRERKIDFLMDLHANPRSLLIRSYFWKIPRLYVDKRTLEQILLTRCKIDLLSPQYQENRPAGYGELLIKRNPRDFAPIFQYDVKGEETQYPLSFSHWSFQTEGEQLDALESFRSQFNLRPPFIVIAPSASFHQKRWPVPSYKHLLSLMLQDKTLKDFQFVITAGPKDDFCEEFSQLIPSHPTRLINLQGQTSLEESIQLLQLAHFCLGNDTGIPHFAESVGTPVLMILGPTGEEFGFYPHLPSSKTLSQSLWCRPCSTFGKGSCIRSQQFCLTEITPERVLRELKELLQLKRGGALLESF